MIVTKKIEWDMGHRVTNHHSKCRNLHGHRYQMEVHVSGKLISRQGDSSEGMVIDFGDIKKIITKHIHDELDHSFMIWEKDAVVIRFFKENSDLKHIMVPFTPTAENIAKWCFLKLEPYFLDKFGTDLQLHEIRLWETPSSYVICRREDVL